MMSIVSKRFRCAGWPNSRTLAGSRDEGAEADLATKPSCQPLSRRLDKTNHALLSITLTAATSKRGKTVEGIEVLLGTKGGGEGPMQQHETDIFATNCCQPVLSVYGCAVTIFFGRQMNGKIVKTGLILGRVPMGLSLCCPGRSILQSNRAGMGMPRLAIMYTTSGDNTGIRLLINFRPSSANWELGPHGRLHPGLVCSCGYPVMESRGPHNKSPQ